MIWRALVLSAALLGPAAGSARAAEPAPADLPRWEVMVAPYAWGTSMTGDTRIKGVEADVDMSFKDILENLNIAFFGKFLVRRDRVFVFSDIVYADLGTDESAGPVTLGVGPATLSTAIPFGPRGRGTAAGTVSIPRIETVVGPADFDVNLKLLSVDLAAGYRVLSHPISDLFGDPDPEDPRRLLVDVFAGGRYWNLEGEIDVFVPPVRVPGVTVNPRLSFSGPRGRLTREVDLGEIKISGLTTAGMDQSFDANTWWIDPMIGGRIRGDLAERVWLGVLGDVGGFGIGSSADFSWQASALLGWQFAEQWTAVLGYRARGIDRDHGDLAIDLVMQGPMLGFIWRFQR